MKKGCFIKSTILLTIFVAALTYIIQNKLDEWVITPAKKVFMPIIEDSYKKEFTYVQDSPEKDSLLKYISSYIKDFSFTDKSDSLNENFWIKLKSIITDSVITTSELEEIKKFLEIENEK